MEGSDQWMDHLQVAPPAAGAPPAPSREYGGFSFVFDVRFRKVSHLI
jgi:hypothetical protein